MDPAAVLNEDTPSSLDGLLVSIDMYMVLYLYIIYTVYSIIYSRSGGFLK
jgi:hypothetical protein